MQNEDKLNKIKNIVTGRVFPMDDALAYSKLTKNKHEYEIVEATEKLKNSLVKKELANNPHARIMKKTQEKEEIKCVDNSAVDAKIKNVNEKIEELTKQVEILTKSLQSLGKNIKNDEVKELALELVKEDPKAKITGKQ
jgi:seryl-tRNA synthetase